MEASTFNTLGTLFIAFLIVGIGNILSSMFSKVSSSYFNLVLGALVTLIPAFNNFMPKFDSELFLLMIISPLLFFESNNTDNRIVSGSIPSIIGTTVFMAVIICLITPMTLIFSMSISFPLAFILTAINTPTDATALDSALGNTKLNSKIHNTLKTESLFNDATGIVLLSAGTIWYKTGHYSLTNSLESFLISSIGAIIVGSIIALTFTLIRQWLLKSSFNVISTQITLFLSTPFIVFWTAEHFHFSGIIAVVVAGLVSNSEVGKSRFVVPHGVHATIQVSSYIAELFNGSVFVFLGINICRILIESHVYLLNHLDWLWAGILVYVVSALVRFVYYLFINKKPKDSFIFAIGGVHGAVTLALALSIADSVRGTHFSNIILATTVVILLSMIIPSVVLPIIIPDRVDTIDDKLIQKCKTEMVQIGIDRINEMDELSKKVKNEVIYKLQDQDKTNTFTDFITKSMFRRGLTEDEDLYQERRAIMYALDSERAYIYKQVSDGTLDSKTGYEITSDILLSETLIIDSRNNLDLR
ncbi:cation:proton antiporter [Lactobacillus terrae]|uniref:cation:proton antiporter n=1 Tax=Lactobacillus terrae TaxID=2269374 RepID=UPI000C1B62AD|nr:cation:proton antiporter [Lactobacillus terrae]